MYRKYTSPLGYQTGTDGIDTYGVNHNGFSLRDELEYQNARQSREKRLMQNFNSQGMDENYPQYTTNFWGNNADNNYGFGMTNISQNIENMNNTVNQNPNYISDDDLYKRMWSNIKDYENVIPYPYLDTKGYITTGSGANINNLNDFMKVNFTVNGNPATDAQKLTGYNILNNMSKETDSNGNYLYANNKANFFKDKTNLQLSEQDAYNMAQNHMRNDLAHVRNQFSDFDTFPNPLKEVLLDIQYNVKGGLNQQNWPNLYNAINNRDIWGKNGIYNNVNRKDVQQSRNDWAKRMIGSIRFWYHFFRRCNAVF